MKNVVNLQFASEMTPKVVRNISKSVLRKSRLHKLHAFMEKKMGDRNVFNDKSDYWRFLQQEWFDRGRSRKWYGRFRCV